MGGGLMHVYWIHTPEHTDMSTQGYIGVTQYFDKRMQQHNQRQTNPHLSNAINKYGWDHLVKETILIADEDYCLGIEQKLRPEENIGWNIVAGGGKPPVNSGPQEALRGRTPWNKGKTYSAETRKKISDAVKAQMADPEHRKRLSEVKKGVPSPMKGKHHSEETKKKMSDARKGKPSNHKGVKLQGQSLENVRTASQVEWKCPHCNTIGKNLGAANRWHFENCKENYNATT